MKRVEIPAINMRGVVALLVCCCLASLAACTPSARPASGAKYAGAYPVRVTVTVGMVADLVREIGGEHVEVQQLMGPGVDPHLYKPSVSDVRAIASADIVFYNGLMLEGKMAEVLKRGGGRRSFAAGESLSSATLGLDDAEHGHPDPHVWMSVELWRQVAAAICTELCDFDSKNAVDYQAAQARLDDRMRRLHAYGVDVMSCIPEEQRVLVTSHDAFRYFGQAYGIEVQAIQGISTESEAGLNRINQLVDMLVTRRVGSVFIESSVPKESIEALLAGAKSRGQSVTIAGTLYSDAMGNAGTYEGTYIGMMDHNLSTIARALGCDAVPESGFKETEL